MKWAWIFCSIIIASLLAAGPSQVRADGAFFSDRTAHLYEPEQKAVIFWDGVNQSMVLSTRVNTDSISELPRLAWLIPTPSAAPPVVSITDFGIFETFVRHFAPSMPFGAVGASGVEVVATKELGIYDVAILKVADAGDLVSWLNEYGFVFPETIASIVSGYLKNGTSYFVANRIDLTNRPESEREALFQDLTKGVATPLRIDFQPPEPFFPLRISSVNEGNTKIDVYFCGNFVVRDLHRYLSIEEVRGASSANYATGLPFHQLERGNRCYSADL